jgi:hypothetical protein
MNEEPGESRFRESPRLLCWDRRFKRVTGPLMKELLSEVRDTE